MVLTLSGILAINAMFGFIVWPPFLRRISADPRATDDTGRRTRFYAVHVVLISIALVLSAVSLAAAIVAVVSQW